MANQQQANGIQNGLQKVFIISYHAADAQKWIGLLKENGYQVKLERDLYQALEIVSHWTPNLILIDVMQPFVDLLWVCRETRNFCSCPILVLTSEYDEQQALACYAAGVNEYAIRPANPEVMLARVKIWVNLAGQFFNARLTDLQVGGLTLKANENQVLLPDGFLVNLTNLEFRLLHLLMSCPGAVFDPHRIVSLVWGIPGKEETNVIKHVIYRLRRKIEIDPTDPKYILSAQNRGYCFARTSKLGS